MKNKKDKLNEIYKQINLEYSNKGIVDEEKLKKDVELLNKQISGMKNSVNKITDEEKKNLKLAEIKKLEYRKQNLEGYLNYNPQIDKIRKNKIELSGKLSKIEKEKESTIKKITNLQKQIAAQNKKLEDLNKRNDPSKTVELTNEQYDKLQEDIKQSKESIEKMNKELKEEITKKESFENRIIDLKGKVGKCDLAWRTLFTNKGWDEIHRRAIEENKAYTKKQESDKEEIKEETKTTTDNNSKFLTTIEKPSLFKRFTNFMKKTANNVKNFFMGDIIDKKLEKQKEEEERRKKIEEIKAKKEQEKNEEIKETTKNTQKDKFLEGLRFNVDKAYKENIIKNKEQTYIDNHKKKKDVEDKEIGD